MRVTTGLKPHVSSTSHHDNPTTMVGLVVPQVDDDEETEEFERQGFVWIDKEKKILGPFYRAEYDEEIGDR